MPKLAHTTVVNYRSRLKLLRLVYDKLPDDEKARATDEIAVLEAKLGPLAEPERRPGRPKVRTEVPDELKPQEMRTAVLSEEEKDKIKRAKWKAKLAKLEAERAETEAKLNAQVQVSVESEFDKANAFITEAIDAEKAQQAVTGGQQGNGRTGSESERGTSGGIRKQLGGDKGEGHDKATDKSETVGGSDSNVGG
jgi:hypothetical protein